MKPEKIIEYKITKDSDRQLFYDIAKYLESEIGIIFIDKIDGLDQKYWDFELATVIFTLHLEHHLGLSVYSNDLSDQNKSRLKNIEEIIKNKFDSPHSV